MPSTLPIKRSVLEHLFDRLICLQNKNDFQADKDFPSPDILELVALRNEISSAGTLVIIEDCDRAEAKFCQICGRPRIIGVVCECRKAKYEERRQSTDQPQ